VLRLVNNGRRSNIATGYSGNGNGLNNPNMQNVADVGPIPRGTWTIGREYNSTTGLGNHMMDLTARAGTNTYNRGLFRIHGDNSAQNHTASHGCII
jgi:lipoprotein-anchoring transpeptidase ErfK/SrfK